MVDTMYIKCIKGIYIEYVVNIHGISIVYYAHILHQVAGVEKEGRVHSTCSTSNHIQVAWTSHNLCFAGTRNEISYRYIQGIYQMPARGQASESGCRAGPLAIYSTTAL